MNKIDKSKEFKKNIIADIDKNFPDVNKEFSDFPQFIKYYNNIELLKNEKFYKAINIKSDTQWEDYINYFSLTEDKYEEYLLETKLFKGFNSNNVQYIHWYVNKFIDTIDYVKEEFLKGDKYGVNFFIRQLHIVIEMLEKFYCINDVSILMFFYIYKHWRFRLVVKRGEIHQHLNLNKELQKQEEQIKSSKKMRELISKKFNSEIEKLTIIYERFAFESMINDFANICNLCKKGYSPNAANFLYNYKSLFVEGIDYYIIFPVISRERKILQNTIDIYELLTGFDYHPEKHSLFDLMLSKSNQSDNLILTPLFKIIGRNEKILSEIFNVMKINDNIIKLICELIKGYQYKLPAKRKRGELSGGKRYNADRNKFLKIRYDHYKNEEGYTAEKSRELVNEDLYKNYGVYLSSDRLKKIV